MSDKHSLERKLQRVGGLKEKYPPWREGGGEACMDILWNHTIRAPLMQTTDTYFFQRQPASLMRIHHYYLCSVSLYIDERFFSVSAYLSR